MSTYKELVLNVIESHGLPTISYYMIVRTIMCRYPDKEEKSTQRFIRSALAKLVEEGNLIRIGNSYQITDLYF